MHLRPLLALGAALIAVACSVRASSVPGVADSAEKAHPLAAGTQAPVLGELEPQILALGYQLIAISPDDATGLRKMSEKNHLDYRLLSDRAMHASADYGVAFRVAPEIEQKYREYGVTLAPLPDGSGKWLPVPTVFLIGRDGVIKYRFSDPDYKVRLSNADLLAAAQKHAHQ